MTGKMACDATQGLLLCEISKPRTKTGGLYGFVEGSEAVLDLDVHRSRTRRPGFRGEAATVGRDSRRTAPRLVHQTTRVQAREQLCWAVDDAAELGFCITRAAGAPWAPWHGRRRGPRQGTRNKESHARPKPREGECDVLCSHRQVLLVKLREALNPAGRLGICNNPYIPWPARYQLKYPSGRDTSHTAYSRRCYVQTAGTWLWSNGQRPSRVEEDEERK